MNELASNTISPGDQNREGCRADLKCLEILQWARHRIENPDHYTSALTSDKDDEHCGGWQEKAVLWSLIGAVYCTFPGGPYQDPGQRSPNDGEWKKAVSLLHRAHRAMGKTSNDGWNGSHELSLTALDIAITLAKQGIEQ